METDLDRTRIDDYQFGITAATGAIAKYQPFDSLSTGRKARSVLRFAHTGEVLGATGQTIAGLASLASVILVITGITITENGTPGKGARFEITVPNGMWRREEANRKKD